MSTRAQIKIVDASGDSLLFYRHSDGYPEGTMPTLNKFLKWVKEGRIRDNVEQAAGWLIIIGALEYFEQAKKHEDLYGKVQLGEPGARESGMGWKVGAYEPATCIHGDIEWMYTVDLGKKKITKKQV